MIAFDLDGVLIPDPPPTEGREIWINQTRYHIPPIFYPNPPYYILTGRPNPERELTLEWAKEYLDLDRYFIITNANEEPFESWKEAASWKLAMINSLPEIHIFIESDLRTVEWMNSLPIEYLNRCRIKVLHFGTFLKELMNSFNEKESPPIA